MTNSITIDSSDEKQRMRELAKVSVSGWLGTALEYIDFQLYGLATALVFNKIFFPEFDPATALIAAMATYGVGYFARLVGAVFFGRMGDRIGRRTVLVITIGLMGGASTLIGVLPTYQQVGIWAPILLLVLRLAQGFGAGAEISGATVLLTEYAPAKHRGILSSLVALGTNSGTLIASGMWLLLINAMPSDALLAWGWRVPFLASFLLMAFAVWVRKHIQETPVFLDRPDVVDGVAMSAKELKEAAKTDATISEALQQRKGKAFVLATLLRFGQAGNSGIVQTFLVGYVVTAFAVTKDVPSAAIVWGSLLGFVTVPLVGLLGDRIGRRKSYMIVSATALVASIPLMYLISTGQPGAITAGFILLLNIAVLSLFSLENVTMAEMFGSRARYTQLALSKEIGGTLATGLGPFIAAVLTAWAHSWWPVLVMFLLFSGITLVTSLLSTETAGRDMSDLKDAL